MLKTIIIKSIIIALAVYIGLGIYLFIFQRKYIYFPDNQDFNSCKGFTGAEIINFNGTRGYYKNNGDKLIIYYHGNAGSACDRAFIKDEFEKAGYSYLFVEYAGYSGDKNSASKTALMGDVTHINEFLKTIEYGRLIIAGESVGASLALYHSTIADEDKVMLLSPYYSLARIGQIHYSLFPIKLLLLDNYDNSEWIGGIKDIMIIHGIEDRIVPIRESKKLFSEIKTDSKRFVEIEEAGHNSLFGYDKTYLSISA